MKYDDIHVSQKMTFLNVAIEMYGATLPAGFDDKADHAEGIIAMARKIESYVFSDFQTDKKKPKVLTEAEQRAAFLESISKESSCGRGKDGCDGSEGTCSCQ